MWFQTYNLVPSCKAPWGLLTLRARPSDSFRQSRPTRCPSLALGPALPRDLSCGWFSRSPDLWSGLSDPALLRSPVVKQIAL